MRVSSWREHPLPRYGEALIFTLAALAAWSFLPSFHTAPFILFLTAVLLSARVCGFGPAIFSALLSVSIIDYFVFPPCRVISDQD